MIGFRRESLGNQSINSVEWSSEHESLDPIYGSSQGDTSETPPKQEIHVSVAEEEKKWVNRLKILVIIVLLTAVIATSLRLYVLLSSKEEEDFKIQFENYADQIIAVSQTNTFSSLETIGSFATSISSYACSSNKIWPVSKNALLRSDHLCRLRQNSDRS